MDLCCFSDGVIYATLSLLPSNPAGLQRLPPDCTSRAAYDDVGPDASTGVSMLNLLWSSLYYALLSLVSFKNKLIRHILQY